MELVVYTGLFTSVICKRQIWMFKNYQSKRVRGKCTKWKDEGTGEKMEGNTERKEHAEIRIIESRQVNIMEERVHRTNNAETAQILMTLSSFLNDVLQIQSVNEVQCSYIILAASS